MYANLNNKYAPDDGNKSLPSSSSAAQDGIEDWIRQKLGITAAITDEYLSSDDFASMCVKSQGPAFIKNVCSRLKQKQNIDHLTIFIKMLYVCADIRTGVASAKFKYLYNEIVDDRFTSQLEDHRDYLIHIQQRLNSRQQNKTKDEALQMIRDLINIADGYPSICSSSSSAAGAAAAKKRAARHKQQGNYYQRNIAAMTPEELAAKRAQKKEDRQKKLAAMPPDELEAMRVLQRDYDRKRRAAMSAEELAELREKKREHIRTKRAAMTPLEREAYRKRENEYKRKRKLTANDYKSEVETPNKESAGFLSSQYIGSSIPAPLFFNKVPSNKFTHTAPVEDEEEVPQAKNVRLTPK